MVIWSFYFLLMHIGQINVVCKANPTLVIADPSNCARHYRCSDMQGDIVPFSECHYPDLYSQSNEICQDFRSVECGSRPEPQAPCKCLTLYKLYFIL